MIVHVICIYTRQKPIKYTNISAHLPIFHLKHTGNPAIKIDKIGSQKYNYNISKQKNRKNKPSMIQNQYIFTRILTTKIYHYIVILQIILTAVLALMVFKQFQKSYVLQIVLVCFMAIDILIRYFGSDSPSFWTVFWNRLDLAIVVLLLGLFVWETLWKTGVQIQEVQVVVIAVRILTQLYRMFRLIKQEKDSRQVQSLEPVDLSFDHENLVDKFH